MKNSTAMSTMPKQKNTVSPVRRRRETAGRGGCAAASNGPMSRAGEPVYTRPAGTVAPSASADCPSRWPNAPMLVLPSKIA